MGERVFIRPRSRESLDQGAVRLTGHALPPELLREASPRLELTARVVGVAFGIVLLLTNALLVAGWPSAPRPAIHNLIALAMVSVSLIVIWLVRWGELSAAHLLNAALLYEVVVAFGISMGDNLAPLSSERPLETISWLCVWIVMFPLVVPAPPTKALATALVAASTWPLAFFIGVGIGQPMPAWRFVLLNFLENYIAAALALVPTLIVRKLGVALHRAREMGSYELVERLGGGGMGEVWRARHSMLARPAAVKLIRPEVLGADGRVAESVMRRFEQEAQATALLHSPHTIELYDFGVTPDGTFFYVMEILDGVDLDALVRRFGPVPAERAVHYLVQACDSLADAHYAGLIHRDVKPANLFACRKGLRHDFLKVLDFGLAKADWRPGAEALHLTTEGTVGGTPAYMAPEVALGDKEIDARVDIYGLGCVAYWLVTGQPVFDARTPAQMVLHHVQNPPVPPSKRTELPIPEALEQLILCCLDKDRDRRPASALELSDRLAACPGAGVWNDDRARRWWEAHLPRSTAQAS